MPYVILNIVSVLVFTQSLRYAQQRQMKDYLVGAVNYVLAAAIALGALAALAACSGMPNLSPAGTLGAVCGAAYFVQFLLLLAAYRLAGVGITMAVMTTGVVVPILASWLFWSESMTPWGWAAVALLPPAMVLMRPLRRHLKNLPVKADVVLAAVFLNSGLMNTLHKAVNVYAPPGAAGEKLLFVQSNHLVYEALLFTTAAVLSVVYAAWRRGRITPAEVRLGVLAGAANVSGTLFAIVGLGVLPAAVFFPSTTSAVIALSVVLSRAFWGERVTGRQVVGLVLAGCIVLLANL